MSEVIAIVGNPNAGKSTLFNMLARADEHVGNYHGVTTEFKEKTINFGGKKITITDLPGTYSLMPYSFEEKVTVDYLQSNKNAKILNIVDGNNLERNLLLTMELLEAGYKPVVCINMKKEVLKSGKKIDLNMLQKHLKVPCFLMDANNKNDGKEILKFFADDKNFENKSQINFNYFKDIEKLFDEQNLGIKKDVSLFEKIKILEIDEEVLQNFFEQKNLEKIKQNLIKNCTLEKIFELRFDIIKEILNQCVITQKKDVYGFSKIDKFVLNKWLCFPIFFLIMALVFWLTFGEIGSFFADKLSGFIESTFLSKISNFVSQNVSNNFVVDFVANALCGSMLAIFSFLPQVVIMMLCLFVLEGSGYMSRIAFCFEDFLKKFGLSGKSIFALLLSFGCSTTATLSSRNLENKNSKIKTAMLTPYISCSAKLPIYSVVCSAFFPRNKFLIVLSLYFLGVAVSLFVSYFMNKTLLKSEDTNFVLEMPKYRIPSFEKTLKNLWSNVKQFFVRAGSILLTFSCIIWIFQNCNFKFEYGMGDSMLESISKFVAPLFAPLGFGTSGAVSVLLCGFVAKEILVSTIGIINGLDGANNIADISNSLLLSSSVFFLTKASSISFLIFSLLYLPCISTVSVMIKEIGRKWTLISCLLQFAISYIISFVAYKISNYFIFNGIFAGFISLAIFALICFILIYVVKILKHKKTCNGCPQKRYCKKC